MNYRLDISQCKLDCIQYQALRIVTGAVRKTSLEALQVECGEMPLKFRRSIFVDKYRFYLMSFERKRHSTVEILQPCWYYDRFHWKTGQGPLVMRACTLNTKVEQIYDCI